MPKRILAVLVSLAVPCLQTAAQIRAGDTAPPITLESISNAPDGPGSVSWDAFGDRVVLLEFWGTWCGPCVAAIPHLNEIAETLEGNENVAFLSVTFEDTGVIGPFLEKQPMRSVIGHDTDRSMPTAFGVRSWPTTFIIKGGEVLFRGHPNEVSAELLAALAEDDADPEQLATRFPALKTRNRAQGAGEDTSDPWSAAPDADVQIMLGPAEHDARQDSSSSRGTSGISFASESVDLAGLIGAVWDTPRHRIVLADKTDATQRYRAVYKAPHGLVESARAFLAASLGVRVETITQSVPGYRAAPAADGPTLAEPVGGGSAINTRHAPGESVHISGPRMTVGGFFKAVQSCLGKPILLQDGLAEREFRCDIELTLDDEKAAVAAIEKTLGLVLTPEHVEIELLRVSPASDG